MTAAGWYLYWYGMAVLTLVLYADSLPDLSRVRGLQWIFACWFWIRDHIAEPVERVVAWLAGVLADASPRR